MDNQIINSSKIPIFVDASSLKNSACFRHFWWATIEGYRNKTAFPHNHKMAFGSAIHKYLETVYKGGTFKEAANCALDYYKPYNETLNSSVFEFRSSKNLLLTCEAYHRRYGNGNRDSLLINIDNEFKPLIDTAANNNAPQVEYKFQIPVWENSVYQLFLAGTIDLVCSYAGYDLVLVDHKSTSSKLNDKFFVEYDWNIQTMLYSKVYKESKGLDTYPLVMINGIFVKKPTKKAEDAGIFDGAEFDRSISIEYDTERMTEFGRWVEQRLATIIHYLDNSELDPRLNYDMSACRSIYGSCQYFDICKLPREFQNGKLANEYEKIKYNPLKFRD